MCSHWVLTIYRAVFIVMDTKEIHDVACGAGHYGWFPTTKARLYSQDEDSGLQSLNIYCLAFYRKFAYLCDGKRTFLHISQSMNVG